MNTVDAGNTLRQHRDSNYIREITMRGTSHGTSHGKLKQKKNFTLKHKHLYYCNDLEYIKILNQKIDSISFR